MLSVKKIGFVISCFIFLGCETTSSPQKKYQEFYQPGTIVRNEWGDIINRSSSPETMIFPDSDEDKADFLLVLKKIKADPNKPWSDEEINLLTEEISLKSNGEKRSLANLYLLRSFIHYEYGKINPSLEDCNMAIENNQTMWRAFHHRAMIYKYLRESTKGDEDLKRVIDLRGGVPLEKSFTPNGGTI